MRRYHASHAAHLAAAAATLLAAAIPASAYTIFTRDGHRIEAAARPEVRGMQAFLRLQPGGRLAVIQEDEIDWERTEAANPMTAPIAVRSADTLTGTQPGAEAPARPIEMKITGGAPVRAQAETPQSAGTQAQPGAPADPAAREAVLGLQKEFGKIKGLRDEAEKQKADLESQLAALQAQEVGQASQDYTAQRKIRELQDRISQMTAHVNKLDSRLVDIRAEALQHGGSVD